MLIILKYRESWEKRAYPYLTRRRVGHVWMLQKPNFANKNTSSIQNIILGLAVYFIKRLYEKWTILLIWNNEFLDLLWKDFIRRRTDVKTSLEQNLEFFCKNRHITKAIYFYTYSGTAQLIYYIQTLFNFYGKAFCTNSKGPGTR